MSRRTMLLWLFVLLMAAAGCTGSLPPGGVTPDPSTPDPNASPVAILVIDDFRPADQPRDGEAPSNGNCPVTPDGQGHFSGGGLGHFSGGGLGHFSGGGLTDEQQNISHGEMVYGKLRELIAADYGAPTTEVAGGDAQEINGDLRAVTIWPAEGEDLILVGVDTRGFDTTTLAQVITTAMRDVAATWSARRFVLNMSFGLIPCNEGAGMTAEQYRDLVGGETPAAADTSPDETEAPLDTLRELLAELDSLVAAGDITQETADSILIGRARMVVFHQQGAEAVYAATTAGGEDDLFQLTQQIHEQPDAQAADAEALGGLPAAAIIVAAAGNSNLSFPFAPAMWPGVLAVGAEPDYANDSEVIMPDQYTLPGTTATTPVTVEGTSFSAPELSFLAAVHLLRGGTADCAGATSPSNPPLSYTNDFNGPWRNLDLSTARTEYCDVFP